MFETVGKNQKVNRRRQAGSLVLACLMMISSGAFMIIGGTQLVVELEFDEPVEVVLFEDLAPPPPPPGPPV